MASTGIFPNETTISIAAADVVGSALATSDQVIGEISNWSQSGGEQEIESKPVIGGFVEKEIPRTQFEISFDVIVSNAASSTIDRWDTYKYGTTGTSAGESISKSIYVEFLSNGNPKTMAFNNCRGVTWDPELAADDMLKGTMTFKFAPTTNLGVANLRTSSLASSDAFFTWI